MRSPRHARRCSPTLARGSNAAWLFPGVAGEPKTANMFSTQITERIQKATGVRMTVHQFRHACAAIYLKHRPGEYETVKRLLAQVDAARVSTVQLPDNLEEYRLPNR